MPAAWTLDSFGVKSKGVFMTVRMKAGSLAVGAGLIALSLAAAAQTGTTTTTTSTTPTTTSTAPTNPSLQKLVTQYTAFAGSTANAESLVKGLSSGTAVTLKSGS